jgi:putative transcriptional regulator
MTENLDFFKIKRNNIPPEKGLVLVSEPFLQDAYFRRSVVLLTEHNEDGTLGFVLNNPIEFGITEILSDFPDIDALVGVGGPVRTDTVHYLHSLGDLIPESAHVIEDLYWGGDFDVLKSLIREGILKKDQIRFFVGFSSWHEGQLERELSENSWMVTSLDRKSIMTICDAGLWEKVLNDQDREYQMWTKYPENPLMN